MGINVGDIIKEIHYRKEEDCDAAIVAPTFPQWFERADVANAYWFAARCDFAWPSRVSQESLDDRS
jgi:hypothetical protein